MKLSRFFILIMLMAGIKVSAQNRVWTVGMQLKPIFSSRAFGTGPKVMTDRSLLYTLRPRGGYAAGMVVRRGYTQRLSFEFGINFTARNYQVNVQGGPVPAENRFRIVAYEIPLSQLVFVRLSEYIYMNASGGLSVNMFPSDVARNNDPLLVYAGRELIIHPGLLANVGFEYRSRKSGYYYLGASLNRPFRQIYTLSARYQVGSQVVSSVLSGFRGTYLTLDLRYFFHEDPDKKIRKKQNGKN